MSQLPQPEADKLNFHFIAFVNVNGELYEFGKHVLALSRFMSVLSCCGLIIVLFVLQDGRMNGPVKHGVTSDESFIMVCKMIIHKHFVI